MLFIVLLRFYTVRLSLIKNTGFLHLLNIGLYWNVGMLYVSASYSYLATCTPSITQLHMNQTEQTCHQRANLNKMSFCPPKTLQVTKYSNQFNNIDLTKQLFTTEQPIVSAPQITAPAFIEQGGTLVITSSLTVYNLQAKPKAYWTANGKNITGRLIHHFKLNLR